MGKRRTNRKENEDRLTNREQKRRRKKCRDFMNGVNDAIINFLKSIFDSSSLYFTLASKISIKIGKKLNLKTTETLYFNQDKSAASFCH